MPKELLADIKLLAEADRRKVTNYIVVALQDHVAEKKKAKK